MRLVLVLALAMVAAGCTAGGPTQTGDGGTPRGPDGLPVPSFGAPRDLSQGRGGPEPVVDVAADGAIYVVAQDAGGGAPHFFASTDGGATWRRSQPSSQSGGEMDLAAGPGGTVYVTQLGPQGNVVSVSRDHGRTWSTTALNLLTTTAYFDREWVAVDARGGAYLVARQFGTLGQETYALSARSDDGGITWPPRGRAWDASNEPGTANGNLLAYERGLAMPYVCRDLHGICIATSTDRAESWTQRAIVERDVRVDNVYPAVAALGGTLVVTWSDASDGRLAVWVASSNDGGNTWTRPWRVSADDESATLPWVAADASRVWVAYLSTSKSLDAADVGAAADASWRAVAVKLDVGAREVTERGLVMEGVVHEGVMSKPVGRPGDAGPYDRSFGDFFTTTLDGQGRLLVALVRTIDGASDDLLVVQQ